MHYRGTHSWTWGKFFLVEVMCELNLNERYKYTFNNSRIPVTCWVLYKIFLFLFQLISSAESLKYWGSIKAELWRIFQAIFSNFPSTFSDSFSYLFIDPSTHLWDIVLSSCPGGLSKRYLLVFRWEFYSIFKLQQCLNICACNYLMGWFGHWEV